MSGQESRSTPIQGLIANAGSRGRAGLLAGAFVAAILVIVGSMGSWTEIGPRTLNGLDPDRGLITLALGIVAAGLIGLRFKGSRRVSLFAASLAFDLIALDGIVDWADVSRIGDGGTLTVEVSAGWGLMLVTVAGIVGAVLTVAAWALDRRAGSWAKRRADRRASGSR